jgi:hypothetical protein
LSEFTEEKFIQLRQAIARILLRAGFHSVHENTFSVLADVCVAFLCKTGHILQTHRDRQQLSELVKSIISIVFF